MQITYKMEPLKSGGFVAYCPAMEPVRVFGKTENEAAAKLIGAAKLYVAHHPEFEKSLKSSELTLNDA